MGQKPVMIIYNVTVNVEESIEKEWVAWMKKVHIPDVMDTGFFTKYTFSKLLHEEQQGKTYTIQYFCQSMDRLQAYFDDCAPDLQKEHTERYKGKFFAFRTFMEVVQSG